MHQVIDPTIRASISNSTFLRTVYGELPPGQHGWVCTFAADPNAAMQSMWSGRAYKGMPEQAKLIDRAANDNAYFSVAVLSLSDTGQLARVKGAFVRLAALVVDDVQLEEFVGRPTWVLETSPGKQIGRAHV